MIHFPSSSGMPPIEETSFTKKNSDSSIPATMGSFSNGSTVSQEDGDKGMAFKKEVRQREEKYFPSLFSLFSKDGIATGQLGGSKMVFVGTSDEAKALLARLTHQTSQEGALKPGTLRLIHTNKSNKEMLFQLKNIKDFSLTNVPKMEATTTYLHSVLDKAYPGNQSIAYLKAHTDFKKYLKSQDYKTSLSDLKQHLAVLQKTEHLLKEITPFSTQGVKAGQPEKLVEGIPTSDFLRAKGVAMNIMKPIGKGAFGIVYAATIDGKEYAYKEEKNALPLNSPELNGKFWRAGDIAASRRKDLAHFAHAVSFVLEVQEPGKNSERWHIPTDQIKEFGRSLPSGTEVKLVAQLMERASGKELREFMKQPETEFNPIEHMEAITKGLLHFLEKTAARNLIHRDLKPENIFFDPSAINEDGSLGRVTVIDFGVGGVYAKPGKDPLRSQNANPSHSTRSTGSPFYMAPAVFKEDAYGSEVDFHSAAILLVEMVDPSETNKAMTMLVKKSPQGLQLATPTSTASFRAALDPNSSLIKKWNAHPEIEKNINLFFAVANAPSAERRRSALEELTARISGDIQNKPQQSKAVIIENDLDAFKNLYGW